jgi:hypothetical protein
MFNLFRRPAKFSLAHELVIGLAGLFLATTFVQAENQSWAPCGGRDGTLWSWAWTGPDGAYVTTVNNSGRDRIVHMLDLSGNENHYFNTTGSREPYFEPTLSLTQHWGTYSTDLAPVSRHRLNNGTDVFQQWMDQETRINAASEFYLAFAGMNTRGSGVREIWGSDTRNNVRIDQGNNRIRVNIAGTHETVTQSGSIPKGPVLIEVWRESDNSVHVWVNGYDVTPQDPVVMSGTFGMKGIGWKGDGSSGWDDYAFEYIACNGLPDQVQRGELRDYLRTKWHLFGESSDTPAAPNPPVGVYVE